MSIADILEKGGPVVWVLAAYSVIALAIIIERYFHFFLMGRHNSETKKALLSAIDTNTLDGLVKTPPGPEGAILREMFNGIRDGITDIGRVASRVGSDELRRMERGLPTLGFLGNTAPLLGLFGTITGMIKAFMVIEQAGGKVDAQALAGGIWEAMVTTGVGLAVSIPILFMLHLLEGMADKRAASMKKYASILLEKNPSGANTVIPVDNIKHREGALDGV